MGESAWGDNAHRSHLFPPQSKPGAVQYMKVSSFVYSDEEAERNQLWMGDKDVIDTMSCDAVTQAEELQISVCSKARSLEF